MMFAKRLRDGVRRGDITCSVRIWQSARVKAGGLYPMGEGHILVESIERIAIEDITGDLGAPVGIRWRDRPAQGREARQRDERLPSRVSVYSAALLDAVFCSMLWERAA